MRIHTDELTRADLIGALPASDVYVYSTPKGSRSRHHAHEVALRGFGKRHTRAPMTAAHYPGNAATFSDWGHWLARLFERDPDAIAGHYHGADDFHEKTLNLYRRPERVGELAQRVLDVQRADHLSRREAIKRVAGLNDLDPWLLERALSPTARRA